MGMGNFPAGAGRMGFDPSWIAPGASAPVPAYPTAIQFDPLSQTFPQDAMGNQVQVNGVDQQVAMLLGIAQGTVASAATFFNRLRIVLNRVPSSSQQSVARQEVTRVLLPLITAGSIVLGQVTVQQGGTGQLQITVGYTNLVTGVAKKVSSS